MMSHFTTVPQATPLDPEKRVNYSLGLVLGVDEFEQEQFYFLERDRQHQRVLHGYGTVCGLQLTTSGSQVLVSPGVAVDTRGRMIQVPRTQCADVNQWLSVADNLNAVQSRVGSPIGPAEAYVVLCYRECQTDSVPVPGAPCRSEDDTLAPSRVTETFELRFTATRPDAAEEAGVRRLGDLLRQIQVTTNAGAGTLLTVPEMERRVRALEALSASPLQSSPPAVVPGEVLLLHPRDAENVLRAGLRVWVTEVRPALLASGCGIPPDECVLLGGLRFAINARGQVDPGAQPEIVVDDVDRPYLVTGRVLQESLLRPWGELGQALGSPVEAAPGTVTLNGDVAGPAGNNTVQRLRGHPVAPDLPQTAGNVLTWMPDGLGSFRWAPAALPALPANLVRFTAAAQAYTIVAAGIVNAAGNPLPQPTFGGLVASLLPVRPSAVRVLLRFNGFQPPNPRLQYVVKALPLISTVEGGPAPIVMFEQTAAGAADPGGLVLAVSSITPNGTLTQFSAASLQQLQLMVEISQYAL